VFGDVRASYDFALTAGQILEQSIFLGRELYAAVRPSNLLRTRVDCQVLDAQDGRRECRTTPEQGADAGA
jgi:hypothetical protein